MFRIFFIQMLLLWAGGHEVGDGYGDLEISATNMLPGQLSYCFFKFCICRTIVSNLSNPQRLHLYLSPPGVEGAPLAAARRGDSQRAQKKQSV